MSQQWQPPATGQPQYRPPPPRPRRQGTPRTIAIAAAMIAVLAAGALLTVQGNSPPPPSTVTFAVTGSPASVTFGDTGSSTAGAVPMRKTIPAGNPLYYSISAQLQGGGSVTCQILAGTMVVSQSTATGGYTIALCEISKDASGHWRDATSGG